MKPLNKKETKPLSRKDLQDRLRKSEEHRKCLADALVPFVLAYDKWNGGDAIGHFSASVCPADFRKAAIAWCYSKP